MSLDLEGYMDTVDSNKQTIQKKQIPTMAQY